MAVPFFTYYAHWKINTIMIKNALEKAAITIIKAVIGVLFYRSKTDLKEYNEDGK